MVDKKLELRHKSGDCGFKAGSWKLSIKVCCKKTPNDDSLDYLTRSSKGTIFRSTWGCWSSDDPRHSGAIWSRGPEVHSKMKIQSLLTGNSPAMFPRSSLETEVVLVRHLSRRPKDLMRSHERGYTRSASTEVFLRIDTPTYWVSVTDWTLQLIGLI